MNVATLRHSIGFLLNSADGAITENCMQIDINEMIVHTKIQAVTSGDAVAIAIQAKERCCAKEWSNTVYLLNNNI